MTRQFQNSIADPMTKPNYKGYESDPAPPDDFSQDTTIEEKAIIRDDWKDDEPEAPITAIQEAKDKLDGILAKKASVPVSALVQAESEIPVTESLPKKSSKPRIKGRSEAQRKSDWRKNNRDHYLQKNREYVKAWRSRKSGKAQS